MKHKFKSIDEALQELINAQRKNLVAALTEEREIRDAINTMRRRLTIVSVEKRRLQRWLTNNAFEGAEF